MLDVTIEIKHMPDVELIAHLDSIFEEAADEPGGGLDER